MTAHVAVRWPTAKRVEATSDLERLVEEDTRDHPDHGKPDDQLVGEDEEDVVLRHVVEEHLGAERIGEAKELQSSKTTD